MSKRPPYVWDYDVDQDTFQAILEGKSTFGRLNQEWAVVRLLEYAAYKEIVSRLGFPGIVQWWPSVRNRIRSETRKRGFDFLLKWLNAEHPELLRG